MSICRCRIGTLLHTHSCFPEISCSNQSHDMGVSSDSNGRCNGHRRVHHSDPCQNNLKVYDDNAYDHASDPLGSTVLHHNFLHQALYAPGFYSFKPHCNSYLHGRANLIWSNDRVYDDVDKSLLINKNQSLYFLQTCLPPIPTQRTYRNFLLLIFVYASFQFSIVSSTLQICFDGCYLVTGFRLGKILSWGLFCGLLDLMNCLENCKMAWN